MTAVLVTFNWTEALKNIVFDLSYSFYSTCRSFRRLLFMDDATEQQASTSSTTSSTSTTRGMDNKISAPPSRKKLQGLPFVKDLRPSVLIGYLTSCGPTQIPSPYLHSSRCVCV